MAALRISSPNLSPSFYSSRSSEPLNSHSYDKDSHAPGKLSSSSSSANPEKRGLLLMIKRSNPRSQEINRKEEEPSTSLVAAQTKVGSDVLKERDEERGGKEAKKKDGSCTKMPKSTPAETKEVGCKNPLSSPPQKMEIKSLRLKAKAEAETRKKSKFSITLSKEEIEEDFFAITRSKRMPKKRKRANYKEIERLFPGSALMSQITPGSYRVRGFPGSRN